jgi:Fe-S-cluster containining protein
MPAKLPHQESDERQLEEVRAIYADLANRPVQRDCIRRTECCQFSYTGVMPLVTKGEVALMVRALRATGRTELPKPAIEGACPMLQANGKCLTYEARPFGCRTHFCEAAGGPYSRKEVVDLIRRLEAVDTELEGEGPHKLDMGLKRMLRELKEGRR